MCVTDVALFRHPSISRNRMCPVWPNVLCTFKRRFGSCLCMYVRARGTRRLHDTLCHNTWQ